MRQGQQNRRGRGRGRKVQNPLSRNYESNGPEVKIRGNASHIAEKYSALARDALASGDTVTAENFLQHAEHYNRIIMAAQSQTTGQESQPAAPGADGANGSGQHRSQPAGRRSDGDGSEAQSSTEAESGATAEAAEAAEAAPSKAKKSNGRAKAKEAGDESPSSDEASSDNAAA